MQIDYTSRDFEALKADLIALIAGRTNTAWDPTDYSDLGNVLVESFAYMGDIMSHYLDRIANETSIDTAIQKSTLLSLASLYDYKPSGPTPAEIQITFTNISEETLDIPVGTQVMAPLSYGPFTQVYFETSDSATAIIPGESITLVATEGKTVNTDRPDQIDSTYNRALPSNLGTSDGSANQQFFVPDSGIIDNSIVVYVGQGVAFGAWSYVDNLLEYGPEDLVFTTFRNDDDTIAVVFGDGINGSIPPSGQLISSIYKVSVGAAGNIKSLQIAELTFIPGNLDTQATSYFTVTNTLPSFGGADSDSLTQLKKKVKAAVSTRRRAVTLDDFAKLALLVSQVGKANAASSVYSSVNLYVQPQNDGTAAPGFPEVAVVGLTADGTHVTYTTGTAHNFSVGDVVDISGIDPIAYNLKNKTITAITTTTPHTFTVDSAVTSAFVTGGIAISRVTTAAWDDLKAAVEKYMADKILAGSTLTVLPPVYVPIYLEVDIQVDPAYKNADIKLAVYQKMLGTGGLFQYDNNTFGAQIPLDDITSALKSIPGVKYSTITKFNTNGTTLVDNVILASNQIAFLTAANLVSNPTGGI
jgi:hypothetical protein